MSKPYILVTNYILADTNLFVFAKLDWQQSKSNCNFGVANFLLLKFRFKKCEFKIFFHRFCTVPIYFL